MAGSVVHSTIGKLHIHNKTLKVTCYGYQRTNVDRAKTATAALLRTALRTARTESAEDRSWAEHLSESGPDERATGAFMQLTTSIWA